MKLFYLTLVVGLALTPAAAFAAQSRASTPARSTSAIAFVSVQRILNESAAAKAANAQLEQLRKEKADEVNAKKKALDETKLALANAGGIFSGSRRAELQARERKQDAELKQAAEDAQKAFLEMQRQLQTAIRNDLGRVLNEIAREQPFQYILNADTSLVWAREATDLTREVLERLNAASAKPPAK